MGLTHVAFTSLPWRRTLMVIAAVGAIGTIGATARVSSCGPAGPGMAPTIAWDGHAVAAAWTAEARRGVGVWALRWVPGEPASEAREVARARNLYGSPEIVSGVGGYLLALNEGDAGLRTTVRSGSDISRVGDTVGAPIRVVCRAPVSVGGHYLVAYGTGEADNVEYFVAVVNGEGNVVHQERVLRGTARAPSCALAHTDGMLGLVVSLDGAHGTRTVLLSGYHRATRDRRVASTLGGAHIRPLRLTLDDDGGWLLYERERRSYLARLGRDGRAVTNRALGDDVTPERVDLAVGARGAAVSWSSKRHVWFATVDERGAERERCSTERRDPSPIRLIAADDKWIAGWTELNGGWLFIASVRGCDGGAMDQARPLQVGASSAATY